MALVALTVAALSWFGGAALRFSAQDASPALAASPDAAAHTKRIADVQVGERVVVDDELGDELAENGTPIDPATWRKLHLHAEQIWPDGTRDDIEVETLQSPNWVAKYDARVGRSVPIPVDLVEMGMPEDMTALVVTDEPCPAIPPGAGRVVTTTINHLNAYLFELTFKNKDGAHEQVRVTGYHKLYSDTHEAWRSAADLAIGEQLHGLSGPLLVDSLERVPGTHRVYNLTV